MATGMRIDQTGSGPNEGAGGLNQPPHGPSPYLVKFGVPLDETLYHGRLPPQLVALLLHIAHEGVTTTDLFRREGSATDVGFIVLELSAGRALDFTYYSFYTLASVVKVFLLRLPGGLFGRELEERLLDVLELDSRTQQHDAVQGVMARLALPTQHLVTLLLGTWFRVVSRAEYNAMCSEALAACLQPCLFRAQPSPGLPPGPLLPPEHPPAPGPAPPAPPVPAEQRTERGVRLLQLLIDDFSVVAMLGRSNLRHFTDAARVHGATRTGGVAGLSGSVAAVSESSNNTRGSHLPPSVSDARPPRATPHICLPHSTPPLVRGSMGAHDSTSPLLRGSRDAHDSTSPLLRGSTDAHDSNLPLLMGEERRLLNVSGEGSEGGGRLSNSASVSAPEVNQVGASPGHALSAVATPAQTDAHTYTHTYAHTSTSSLNRADDVRRLQLLRMHRRSSWFLGGPPLHAGGPRGGPLPAGGLGGSPLALGGPGKGLCEDPMSRSFELRRQTLSAFSPARLSLAGRSPGTAALRRGRETSHAGSGWSQMCHAGMSETSSELDTMIADGDLVALVEG